MPRKPVLSKHQKQSITDGEKYLLFTGECCLPNRKKWADGSSWVRPFILASPGGRDQLMQLWERNKGELMSEWKAQGKRGQPWIVRELKRQGVSNAQET